jgi:hypothetical protein
MGFFRVGGSDGASRGSPSARAAATESHAQRAPAAPRFAVAGGAALRAKVTSRLATQAAGLEADVPADQFVRF